MSDVAEIVRCHHESPDGNGYPRGLSEGAIPIEAAIVKTAEAFVAMTSPRVYRGKALSRDQALDEIAGSVGRAFDPIAAYYLFDTMGRGDLASDVSRQFGLPEKRTIRSRLARPRLQAGGIWTRPVGRSILAGLALLSAALGLTVLFDGLGISKPPVTPPTWFTLSVPGALFLLSLFGLAVLKPGRLAFGANCSWASAPMLAMVLAGGPIYIPISGMAFIGWALVLKPGPRSPVQPEGRGWGLGDRCEPGEPGNAEDRRDGPEDNTPAQIHEIHAAKFHHQVIARIDRSNRVLVDLGAVTYGLVLMLAGGCAWAAGLVGHQVWKGSIAGLLLSPLLLGIICTGTFYMSETLLQAALLSRGALSTIRIWYRNYADAFPEPLTYAILGYGIYIVSSLLGLSTALLVFTLPVLWRQGVLADRMRTKQVTGDLVRSIAKAVDLKNSKGRSHARGVATIAVAIARRMGKTEPFVEQIEDAAILHDIGKASWPNKALVQHMPWDSKEERYRYIHPDISAEIATWAGYPGITAQIIRSHHEHYDGSGYMRGLKGAEIPAGARILSAADSFANMIHGGDPRFSRTLAETVREIRFGSGKQFDPDVVRALMAVLEGAVFGESPIPERPTPADVPEEAAVGTPQAG
jgi:putative nucleotidyltransferase with HDIG domain